jgi:hypothetical protein
MRKRTGILIKSACVVVASVCAVLVGIHGADNLQKQAIAKLERGAQQLVERTIIGTINNLGINLGVEHIRPAPRTTMAAESVRHEPNRSLKGDRKAVTADRPKPVTVVTYRQTPDTTIATIAMIAELCSPTPCVER